MSGGIFISYRRSDSAAFAGRIADFYAYKYPDIRIFFDTIAIEPGEDFVASIRARLAASEIVLAIIGEDWLDATNAQGQRRLTNRADFVRLELVLALQMNKRVVPVLLDGANMPSERDLPADLAGLARCNAELVRGAAFQRDAEHLGQFTARFLSEIASAPPAPRSPVRDALVGAFTRYRDTSDAMDYMICSDSADRFVQFMKDAPGHVLLDLPTVQMNAAQRRAARAMFMETYELGPADVDDDDFIYQLILPDDPSFLSHFTLDIFEHVYGVTPALPLDIEINH